MSECKVYRVRAIAQRGRAGFRRGGRFFRADSWTELTEREMVPAIRDEAQLIVERITDLPATNDPGLVIGHLKREKGSLEEQLRQAQAARDASERQAAGQVAEVQQLRSEQAKAAADLAAVTWERDQVQERLAAAQTEVDLVRLQLAQAAAAQDGPPVTAEEREQLGQLQRENAELKTRLDESTAGAQAQRNTIDQLRAENARLADVAEAASKERDAAKKQLEPMKAQIRRLQESLEVAQKAGGQ